MVELRRPRNIMPQFIYKLNQKCVLAIAISEESHKMKHVNSDSVFEKFTYKINNIDKAKVCASRKHNSARVTVTVKLVGVLDLRAVYLMHNIYEFAKNFKAAHIIVDLRRTHHIHDSGLAMLLLLKNKLGSQIEKIKLTNTSHLMNRHFAYLPITFEIS